MIDTTNDIVEIFDDNAGDTTWRRKDGDNHRELSRSSEGYQNAAYAREAAQAYNPGIPVVQVLHETAVDGKPLGRHVQHDPRSWDFQAERASALVTTVHARHGGPFNQGQLGSCTGNAMAGILNTDPLFKTGRLLTEKNAVTFYEYATRHDNIKGTYPPTDTGSSGLAVAKAARSAGFITAYRHAFGLQHALEALVLNPWICGTEWLDSFDEPDSNGIVRITPNAGVRGGHEYEGAELHVDEQLLGFWNSWGPAWGLGGRFFMTWDDFDELLHRQGDVTTVTA